MPECRRSYSGAEKQGSRVQCSRELKEKSNPCKIKTISPAGKLRLSSQDSCDSHITNNTIIESCIIIDTMWKFHLSFLAVQRLFCIYPNKLSKTCRNFSFPMEIPTSIQFILKMFWRRFPPFRGKARNKAHIVESKFIRNAKCHNKTGCFTELFESESWNSIGLTKKPE